MDRIIAVWRMHMNWMAAQMMLANKYGFEINNGRRMMLDTVVIRQQLSPSLMKIGAILTAGLPAPGMN